MMPWSHDEPVFFVIQTWPAVGHKIDIINDGCEEPARVFGIFFGVPKENIRVIG